MSVFRVYETSYEGDYTLAVFTDREVAITYARAESRLRNESFGGAIGVSVRIEELDPPVHRDLGDEWKDWAISIEGNRFVAVENDA